MISIWPSCFLLTTGDQRSNTSPPFRTHPATVKNKMKERVRERERERVKHESSHHRRESNMTQYFVPATSMRLRDGEPAMEDDVRASRTAPVRRAALPQLLLSLCRQPPPSASLTRACRTTASLCRRATTRSWCVALTCCALCYHLNLQQAGHLPIRGNLAGFLRHFTTAGRRPDLDRDIPGAPSTCGAR